MALKPSTTKPVVCPCPVAVEIHEMVKDHENRLVTVEANHSQISELVEAVEKIGKLIKLWGPTLIGAAISAGIVNGKLGAFLHAIMTGNGGA